MHRNLIKTMILAASTALILPTVALAGGDAAAGKSTFTANCISCHGPSGKGDGPLAAALTPKPRDLSMGAFNFDTDGDGTKGSDADLMNVIKNGAAAYGGSPLMAPWPALSDGDIANLVAFIRSLKG
jgi:mono/diheme cytochrome c family protein